MSKSHPALAHMAKIDETLNIHTLDKSWCDKDEVLLHAAFQLLTDFIERECPDQIVNYNHSEESQKRWDELQALYHWWTVVRPSRQDSLLDPSLKTPPIETQPSYGSDGSIRYRQRIPYNPADYPEYHQALVLSAQLEQAWFEEDQQHLHRLVDIRPYLWC